MRSNPKSSSIRFIIYLLLIPALLMSFGKKQRNVNPETTRAVESMVAQDTPDIAPVDLTKVTNVVPYGERMDPATNKLRNHTGVDFALGKGSDVIATADGIVVVQRYGDKPGNYVVIKHNETLRTRYYHLETALVKEGDRVKKGQVIGLVGSTGLYSTAPHLHYEVLRNDAAVDPKDYLPRLPRF